MRCLDLRQSANGGGVENGRLGLVAVGPALTAERHRMRGTPNGLGGRP
jgi:hypothetical protein